MAYSALLNCRLWRARCLLWLFLSMEILTGCCAHKSTLVDGIRYFRAQNYRPAFQLLLPEARRGQPDAEYAVGYMYYYGLGVVEDHRQAWTWINRAAQLKQPHAMEAVKILTFHP